MAYTPPTYAPSGSIFGTTAATTPYTYGNLLPSTSSYNIWGSKGNPYITAGPTYTPGSGAPIVPYNYRPYVAPTNTGGGDSFVEPTPTTRYPNNYEIVEGQPLETGSEFITSNGDIDWGGIGNPDYTTVDGVGVTNPDGFYGDGTSSATSSATGKGEGFSFGDLFSTPNVGNVLGAITTYGTPYGLVGSYLGGKAWENYMTTDGKGVDIVDKSFGYGTDNPNGTAPTNNGWGSKGFTGDLFNTSTGRGLATPKTFGNPNSALAQQARAGIASEATRVATNIAINEAKAAQAAIAAENPAQAARDAAYVGTSDDGYAATANRYGTIPGSEQTAMLAEQDMGMSDSSDNGYGDSSGGGGGWEGSDANSDMDSDSGWSGADSDFSDSDSGGSDDSGGGGSYIATAATQSLGTVGLTVFNNWRDYMHTCHPTFTISFGRYRVTAPKIVKAIDAKDNSKELYKEIWDKHLGPIYKLIVNKDDTNALVKYKVMVKELMNKYLKGDK